MAGYDFTERSRRVVQAAGDEAAALRHDYIGTEHILLAILRDPDNAAVALLTKRGIDISGIRAEVTEIVKPGTDAAPPGAQRPYTSRVKLALELAMSSARDGGTRSVGTQHLLLGLLREDKGIAAQALAHAGLTVAGLTSALGDAGGD